MKNHSIAVLSILAIVGLTPNCRGTAPWFQETFDAYSIDLLGGQGEWTGTPFGVYVVSTNSLTGQAGFCDADFPPIMIPYIPLRRPVKVPDSGRHVFSFAVRVDTPTASFAPQAMIALGNDETWAIRLDISPLTADLEIRNDFTDCYWRASWDLGVVPGGYPDLTTGVYHVFEFDLDFGRPDDNMDDRVRDVRLDGRSQGDVFTPPCPAHICLRKPMDALFLVDGDAVEGATPDAVFFDEIVGRPAPSANWLHETFDEYASGPLLGQGEWTGVVSYVAVVSSNSLAGNAAFCDADDPPLGGPFSTEVWRPVAVPDSGEHVLAFAVRFETPTESFDPQASLVLGSSVTRTIELEIGPRTVYLYIRNDFLDCIGYVAWDLGTSPGLAPDLTTGTYHLFELDLDFGRPGDTMDDAVRAVRVDGASYDFGCGSLAIQSPMNRLTLINGMAQDGAKPDAVFFDNIFARVASLSVRRWSRY